MVLVDITLGDLVDRITIAELKAERNPARFGRALAGLRDSLPVVFDVSDLAELRAINSELWEVEDRLRQLIAESDFGSEFVDLARAVPRLNDARARARARVDGAEHIDKVYAVRRAADVYAVGQAARAD
jgi:hypothetical protein